MYIRPLTVRTKFADFVFRDHHHHHHIALVARISLTLSRHSSLSFIALGRSSGRQPVSSHSCWMYVRAGRPAFARPCLGIHKSTSLTSSFLLLQQCPACLVILPYLSIYLSIYVCLDLPIYGFAHSPRPKIPECYYFLSNIIKLSLETIT